MDKQNPPGSEEISFVPAILFTALSGLIIFFLFTGYFLGLAWLTTLLAPLTYFQAAAFAFLVVASGFMILARLPRFQTSLILWFLLVFAVLALLEIIVARLVAFITPLVVWEASLLVVASVALLMFIVVQTILDNSLYEEMDDDDEWVASTTGHRLSPDMYVFRPQSTEKPKRKRRHTSRRRSRGTSDDTDTN